MWSLLPPNSLRSQLPFGVSDVTGFMLVSSRGSRKNTPVFSVCNESFISRSPWSQCLNMVELASVVPPVTSVESLLGYF